MSKTKKITLSAMLIALGLVLPFITGQIPEIGSMLLPIHYGSFFAGFILGPLYGACVGFLTPILRSILFSMPPMLPAIVMSFECAAYGLFVGLIYKKIKRTTVNTYVSLVLAMLLGRVVWGVANAIVYGSITLETFIMSGFVNSILGIVIQIILIPIIIKRVEKTI